MLILFPVVLIPIKELLSVTLVLNNLIALKTVLVPVIIPKIPIRLYTGLSY